MKASVAPDLTVQPAVGATHVCDYAGVCRDLCILQPITVGALPSGAPITQFEIWLDSVRTVGSKDTGAMRCCIAASEFDRINAQGGNIALAPTARVARGANNALLTCRGQARIPVRIGTLHTVHEFLVIEDLCYKVILGNDFWRTHEKLDYTERGYTVLKDGCRVPYFRVRAGNQELCGAVAVTRTVVCPPHSLTTVWCKVKSHIRPGSQGLFEPTFRARNGVLLAAHLGTVDVHNRVPIQLLNASAKTQKTRTSAVGRFSVLNERADVICLLQEAPSEFAVETGNLPCDADVLAHSTTRTGHGEGSARAADGKSSTGPATSSPGKGSGESAAGSAGADTTEKNTPPRGTTPVQESPSPNGSNLPPGFQVPAHPDMTPEYREMIEKMVARMYARGAFSSFAGELGKTTLLQAKLDTVDATPVQGYNVRMDRVRLDAAHEIARDMHRQDMIGESTSAYRAPVLLVKKPNGSWRFVNDFRLLNQKLVEVHFPLPRIDDSLEAVQGNTWFATADLSSGYWQMEIAPEDRHKTAFSLPGLGNFEYKRLPMGIASSAAYFQKLMAMVLKGLSMNICVPYLDDILIVGTSLPELVERCELVFSRIADAGLKLNPAKTIIGAREIKFLGFRVSKDGIRADDKHTEKIRTWPVPQTVKDVRRFYGLANYLRKHIQDFGRIAAPLSALTAGKKNGHRLGGEWVEEVHGVAFQQLKDALISPPVLAFPDFAPEAAPFHVKPDACKIACGATLTQEQGGSERVIAYASHTFSQAQRRWPITEKESYGIWWAITKEFHPYVYGREFHVYTDHKPCLAMKRSQVVNERMLRMALDLTRDGAYKFQMFYKAGETHEDADAMSRLAEALAERVDGKPGPCPCSDCTLARAQPASGSTPVGVIADTVAPVPDMPTDMRSTAATAEYCTPELARAARNPYTATGVRAPQDVTRQREHGAEPEVVRVAALSGAGYQHDAVFKAQQQDAEIRALYAYLDTKEVPKSRKEKNRVLRQAPDFFLEKDIVYRNAGPSGKQLFVLSVCDTNCWCSSTQCLTRVMWACTARTAPSVGTTGGPR